MGACIRVMPDREDEAQNGFAVSDPGGPLGEMRLDLTVQKAGGLDLCFFHDR